MWWFVVLDLSLLILTTLRLTRLVTTDSLGQWWLYAPVYKRVVANGKSNKWQKYVDGLTCPFCIGFWIGGALVLSLWMVGGVGDAAEWWRWTTGIFALNYVTGHVASWLD
jgi:hypothetical protein